MYREFFKGNLYTGAHKKLTESFGEFEDSSLITQGEYFLEY